MQQFLNLHRKRHRKLFENRTRKRTYDAVRLLLHDTSFFHAPHVTVPAFRRQQWCEWDRRASLVVLVAH